MVPAPPPCGPRPGPRSHKLPRECVPAPGPGSPALCDPALRRPRGGRWRRAEDPRPSAHLKLSAASDWSARRGPGEGRRLRHWPRGAPVTVPAARRPAPAPRGPKQPRVLSSAGGLGHRWGVDAPRCNLGPLPAFPWVRSQGAGTGNPRTPEDPRDGPRPAPETPCPLRAWSLEPAVRVLSGLLAGPCVGHLCPAERGRPTLRSAQAARRPGRSSR
ncbi:uncharacterized protein LOC118143727 isoform X1 [Callithrix jacchus]